MVIRACPRDLCSFAERPAAEMGGTGGGEEPVDRFGDGRGGQSERRLSGELGADLCELRDRGRGDGGGVKDQGGRVEGDR